MMNKIKLFPKGALLMKNVKYLVAVLVVLVLLVPLPVYAGSLLSKVSLNVGGVNTEVTLLLHNGEMYVPLAAVIEMLENVVDWSSVDNIYTLSYGSYIIGEDIPHGRYDIRAISGRGIIHIIGRENFDTLLLSANTPEMSTFRNFRTVDGGDLRVETTLVVQFILLEAY
jgi:hypothetical protein